MTAVAPFLCNEAEARTLTEDIRRGVEKVHQLLVRSHEWQAWRALGYVSWRDYAMSEFGISKSHAYRLLDQARVIAEIEAASDSPMGERGDLTERQTRELAPIIAEHGAKAAAEVLSLAAEQGKPTAAAIRQVAADTGRAKVTTTTRTTEATKVEQDVDLATGEILDGPTPATPGTNRERASRRRPLPDAFFRASYDLNKTATSLRNLTTDDRWSRNAEQVTRYRNDLLRTRDLIDQVIAALPNTHQEG